MYINMSNSSMYANKYEKVCLRRELFLIIRTVRSIEIVMGIALFFQTCWSSMSFFFAVVFSFISSWIKQVEQFNDKLVENKTRNLLSWNCSPLLSANIISSKQPLIHKIKPSNLRQIERQHSFFFLCIWFSFWNKLMTSTEKECFAISQWENIGGICVCLFTSFISLSKMFEKLLLIRSVSSICKRNIRTAAPTTTTTNEERTAIDSSGKVFTFQHG